MLPEEYEKLIKALESMMTDGVSLTYGGMLLEWEDTIIPRLIRKIREKQARTSSQYSERSEKTV